MPSLSSRLKHVAWLAGCENQLRFLKVAKAKGKEMEPVDWMATAPAPKRKVHKKPPTGGATAAIRRIPTNGQTQQRRGFTRISKYECFSFRNCASKTPEIIGVPSILRSE